MSFRYAICNETFVDWPHESVCEFVAATGYTGLELAPFTFAPLVTDLSAARRAEIRTQAESRGLSVVGLHWLLAKTDGFMITSPDAAVRKRTGQYLAELARCCRDVGGDILVLGSPMQRRIPPGATRAQAEDYALDCLRHVLPELERQRVYLCLEPLAPAEADFLQTAAEGKALMDRLANPWVKLHLDVKAMSSEAKPVPDVIREFAPWMKHFHANDANRRGPGFGQTDFVPIFRALRDVNYPGWVSVEVFDYTPDPETIARESLRHMRECEARVRGEPGHAAMPDPSPDPTPRGSWAALFHQTTDPVFLLNSRRRLRYVNSAFETVARTPADGVLHEYCHPRKVQKDLPVHRRLLLQALAPPKEVMAGRTMTVRRPVPPAKLGPPWWDVTFVPLREGDKLIGVMGTITPVGSPSAKAGGKGLSEPLIALRQTAVERAALERLFPTDTPAARRLRAQAELAAKTLSPVWLTGGPGTGKETLARAIHYHGTTRERAFAGIDCAGLQPYLVRSLLFGHNGLAETGRFGTIYLKAAAALPADLQVELIEWGELLADECRLIIDAGVGTGLTPEFRAAFGVIEIHLPALADRKEEWPALLAATAGREAAGVSPEAAAVLAAWSWPGNLRELRDVIRSSARRAGGRIEVAHLPTPLRRSATDTRAARSPRPQALPKLDEVLEQVERRLVELALQKTKGDQTAAADMLGVYRSRLVRRLKALGLGEE